VAQATPTKLRIAANFFDFLFFFDKLARHRRTEGVNSSLLLSPGATMSNSPDSNAPDRGHHNSTSASSRTLVRRDLLKAPLALAAGALVSGGASEAKAEKSDVSIDPRYYPRKHFDPDIDLSGKLAVITGASRGIGRAIGEILAALGVDVIGTSRNPAGVPDPPDFPLLALDITDPASVFGFIGELVTHPLFAGREQPQVDILVNNAGRYVIGRIVPQPSDFTFYLAQRDLGVRTVYSGHVTVTNAMLPLMAPAGYARILFTVSISGYMSAALLPAGSFQDVYASAKSALRGYANNLDGAVTFAGASLRVSTVSPYFVNTAILTHPNPVYTQPVNGSGVSDDDSVFNAALAGLQALTANGLPPNMVGEACAQLLRMQNPEQNVVVASPKGALAEQGANDLIEPEILAENLVSAVPFTSR
jgi:3-oxoacyl-[acyl-carrier protein] reductase